MKHRTPSQFTRLVALALTISSAPAWAQTNAPRPTPKPTSQPTSITKPTAKISPTPAKTANAGGVTVATPTVPPTAVADANSVANNSAVAGETENAGNGLGGILLGAVIGIALGALGMGFYHSRRGGAAAPATTKPKASATQKTPRGDSLPAPLRERLDQLSRSSAVRNDALLDGALALSTHLLELAQSGTSKTSQATSWKHVELAREELVSRTLAEADPNKLLSYDAKSLGATLQMATQLDALCNDVPPTKGRARVQPLSPETAKAVMNWVGQLREETSIGEELKTEMIKQERLLEKQEKELARLQKTASADATEIQNLRAQIETQKTERARDIAKLREQARDSLEKLATEHQQVLTQIGADNQRLQKQYDQMKAAIDREFERGVASFRGEVAGSLDQLKRFSLLARQQGELEDLSRAALERLHAVSEDAALATSVGFLLEHCLAQLAQCVHLDQPRRRELALNGIAEIAAGLQGVPAFEPLARRAREFGGGKNSLPTTNAPHRDRTLFYVALSFIRRHCARYGDFPRRFGFELDENGAAYFVESDD